MSGFESSGCFSEIPTCSVCLNPLVIDESIPDSCLQTTKCGHVFHKCCLRPVVAQIGRCPLCRQNISMSSVHDLFLELKKASSTQIIRIADLPLDSSSNELTSDVEPSQSDVQQRRLATLQQAVSEQQRELREQHQMLREEQQAKADVERQKHELEQQYVRLQRDNQQLIVREKAMAAKLNDQTQLVQERSAVISEKINRVTALEGQAGQQRKLINEQAEELRALKLKNESLQQLAQLAQTGSVDLERWVISSHEFDKMIKFELQGRYLNLVTAYRAEKEGWEKMKAELAQTQAQSNEFKERFERLCSETDLLKRSHYSALKKARADHVRDIDALRIHSEARALTQSEQSARERADLQQRIETLNEERRALQLQVQVFKQRAESLAEQVATLSSKVEQQQQTFSTASSAAASAASSSASLSSSSASSSSLSRAAVSKPPLKANSSFSSSSSDNRTAIPPNRIPSSTGTFSLASTQSSDSPTSSSPSSQSNPFRRTSSAPTSSSSSSSSLLSRFTSSSSSSSSSPSNASLESTKLKGLPKLFSLSSSSLSTSSAASGLFQPKSENIEIIELVNDDGNLDQPSHDGDDDDEIDFPDEVYDDLDPDAQNDEDSDNSFESSTSASPSSSSSASPSLASSSSSYNLDLKLPLHFCQRCKVEYRGYACEVCFELASDAAANQASFVRSSSLAALVPPTLPTRRTSFAQNVLNAPGKLPQTTSSTPSSLTRQSSNEGVLSRSEYSLLGKREHRWISTSRKLPSPKQKRLKAVSLSAESKKSIPQLTKFFSSSI